MTYVTLPEGIGQRHLPFFLAMEEYVASSLLVQEKHAVATAPAEAEKSSEAFFLWQVEPTVIFGRHQVIENEVNLDYCRRHGIRFYRRKSGGGCVYADRSNVMMSYITLSDEVQTTFSRYMQMVVGMLRTLGIEATSTQNNDILIDGRKVSGNAFYHLPGISIVHGTMLFDTDMQHMLHAITPPRQKLTKHGVESVRQRITLMREHTDLSIDDFIRFAADHLCTDSMRLTLQDVEAIETIEEEYLAPEFIMKGSLHSHNNDIMS